MVPVRFVCLDVAREKAKAAKSKQELPKYRDRAAERRVMHNQPDIPLPEPSAEAANRKRHAEGPPPPPSPPPPPVNPGEDESNVGNKLLRMMGWQAGTGLGQDGEGRVEPMYVFRPLYQPCCMLTYYHFEARLPYTPRALVLVPVKVKKSASMPTDTPDTCIWRRMR